MSAYPDRYKGNETILMADDDTIALNSTSRILTRQGYSVVTACNGHDAVIKFSRRNDVKLVILDIVMPVKGGIDAFKEIRLINPRIPIFLASAYPIHSLDGLGRFKYFKKPLNVIEILENLRISLDNIDL